MRALGRAAPFFGGLLCLALWVLPGCDISGADSSASLLIESQPLSGVAVLVDGEPKGDTPLELAGLPAGHMVMVQLTHPGYKDSWRTVTVPKSGQQRVNIEMEPRVGLLSLKSNPTGALVVWDGKKELGKTPLVNCPVPVGEHTYELRMDNFQPSVKKLTVEEDFRYDFVHELQPMEGRILVLSTPSGAAVALNDQPQVERTPATFNVVPGTYTVSVNHKGYVLAEDTVTVGPNEEKRIALDMKEGHAPEGMVLVPAGKFIRGNDGGAPDERPMTAVFVDAYYIDKYEVTNVQYQLVVPTHSFKKGEENFPVTGVTWEQAAAYAQKLGKRLPKEVEWEKAARGEKGLEYPWGNRFDPSLCNSADTGGNDLLVTLMEVGSYRAGASPYGCMDMAGNAFEWTSDWYSAYEGNTDIQKDYGQMYRVLRGGSYLTDKYQVRCVKRHYDRPESQQSDYGFRCAKDVEQAPKERVRDASLR